MGLSDVGKQNCCYCNVDKHKCSASLSRNFDEICVECRTTK